MADNLRTLIAACVTILTTEAGIPRQAITITKTRGKTRIDYTINRQPKTLWLPALPTNVNRGNNNKLAELRRQLRPATP